jgi:hypothetical protein
MYGEAARTNQMINDVICLVPMHVHFFKKLHSTTQTLTTCTHTHL